MTMLIMANMREYFREALEAALKKRRVPLTDTAQAYVVNLLAEFAKAERVSDETMVDLLSRAQDAEPQEAVRIYKHMGDSSLYRTGFFQDTASNGVGYYVSMGGGAYKSVAGLIRPTAASSSALFDELGDRFEALVDLLTAMSLHGEPADTQVLELVERYKRTGNPEILDALRRQGVVLRPGIDDDDLSIN